MYGLLLDTIQKFIREKYGENYWVSIRRRAKLTNHWFVTHEVYPESVIPTLVDAVAEELGEDRDDVMKMFGEYFAENIGRYGYARLLRVLGRDLRDFFNGLVDLHEYLRFSYPNMSPPAFFTSNETPEGLHLHYITKREGFLCYVTGQITTIGKIYGKQLEVSLVSKDQTEKGEYYFILDLKFDNREMMKSRRMSVVGSANFHISSETFFRMFPFSFVFSQDFVILRVGCMLQEVLPGLCGEVVSSAFTLTKPYMAELDWSSIQLRTNCTFELQSVRRVQPTSHDQEDEEVTPEQAPHLKLKGEMMVLDDVNYIAFLCSPAMDSPEDLYESGIFISDLSLHNCSREFIMAGSQKHPELNIAFNQERIRSAQLETSIKKTDELLYQMIPKSIADKLRSGRPPLSTCQEFDSVSILFSDIVSFTPMCTRLAPMQVVCVLNSMCTAYDRLCEKHNVYKVEMIGDAYMVLAGGPIPSRPNTHHAESIANYGLGILEATKQIVDPSTSQHLRIRVGIHSGGIVAGVVGTTTQRYDVFGDTVNIAARMESTGEPMRIQVSETTAALLQDRGFQLTERGQVEVKGKGLMKTFWVDGKQQQSQPTSPTASRGRSLSLKTPVTKQPAFSFGGSLQPKLPHQSAGLRPLRRGSPAPDEWPQAELRLNDRHWLSHQARSHRSLTLPNIDISGAESELICPIPCPYNHAVVANSLLSDPASSTVFPFTQHITPHHTHTPTQSPPTYSSPQRRGSLGLDRGDQNLVQVQQTLIKGLSTIAEASEDVGLSQLEEFAEMAEESARAARRLADAAAELVAARQRRPPSQPSLTAPVDEESSVDPPPTSDFLRQYLPCVIL